MPERTVRVERDARYHKRIEYANTSLEKDLQLKDKIYASANIPEYWVVNLQTRELIVLRDPANGAYQSIQKLTSGTIFSESFPTIPVEVLKLIQ